MRLPEENRDIFELFVQWLYTQRIERHTEEVPYSQRDRLLELMHLFTLADRLDVPAF